MGPHKCWKCRSHCSTSLSCAFLPLVHQEKQIHSTPCIPAHAIFGTGCYLVGCTNGKLNYFHWPASVWVRIIREKKKVNHHVWVQKFDNQENNHPGTNWIGNWKMVCLILEKSARPTVFKGQTFIFSVCQVSQCLHLVSWTGRLLASDLFLLWVGLGSGEQLSDFVHWKWIFLLLCANH